MTTDQNMQTTIYQGRAREWHTTQNSSVPNVAPARTAWYFLMPFGNGYWLHTGDKTMELLKLTPVDD